MRLTINKYVPFAFLYFFVNSVGLPFGLTYTSLLAPFFYAWILLVRKKELVLPFMVILVPFLVVHVTNIGVEEGSYLVSLINLLLVYVFCQAVYTFLMVCRDVERVFQKILLVNFAACLLAIPFFFTSYYYLFWDEQVLTEGVGRLRRFRLSTYEPSYYALLFVPVFFFFLLQYFFRQNRIHGVWLIPMLVLPYLLSFSIGVMGAIGLSLLLTWLVYFKRLTSRKRILNAILTTGFSFVSLLFIVFVFFRSNPIFTRIGNILGGRDTSGKGRTVDAFLLATRMLNEKNEYWGIGLGQVKLIGDGIIRDFYLYDIDIVATLPNAAAETLAIFGWTGFILRLAIEIFLFFFTRVWNNYYRLLIFFFVFIYQFTGSFITNAAEYVLWIFAFANVFRQFEVMPNTSEPGRPGSTA